MTDELRQEIELLKAQVAALTDERLPKVDRASKRRDRRQVLGGFGMFAVALTVAGTLSASALAGTNTVFSDDIKDGQVYTTDIHDSTLSGTDVRNDSLTGADINESTLVLPASGGTPDDDSVTSAKILDGAIGLADLNGDAVNGSKVVDDSLTGADIDESTLTSPGLADGSVTSAKLADNAVTNAKLADNAVTSSSLGTITQRASATRSVEPGTSGFATALCLAGETALTGGVLFGGTNVPDAYTQTSYREANNAWTVMVFNATDGPTPRQFRAVVDCLAP